MPSLLILWCNVVKRNWTIILMQTVLLTIDSSPQNSYGKLQTLCEIPIPLCALRLKGKKCGFMD